MFISRKEFNSIISQISWSVSEYKKLKDEIEEFKKYDNSKLVQLEKANIGYNRLDECFNNIRNNNERLDAIMKYLDIEVVEQTDKYVCKKNHK